jgi:uncharacterized protein
MTTRSSHLIRRTIKTVSILALLMAGIRVYTMSRVSQHRSAPKGLEGDWKGTLKAGDVELRLLLHLRKGDDGGLTGTLDSIDQGASGLQVSSVSLKNSTLTFEVDSVHGHYEGRANDDATEIDGTWSQGQPLPLKFQRTAASADTASGNAGHKPTKASDIDGTWLGSIDAGAAKLRIIFHITNTEDGLMATMDSPDQNAKGVPVTSVTRNHESIVLEMKQIGGKFEGKIGSDLTTMDGTWTQGGNGTPLVLKRVKDAAMLERRKIEKQVTPGAHWTQEVVLRTRLLESNWHVR